MTEKPFFEVFRTLEVDNQTRALFEQVVVTRVSTSPSQDVLRVYITSKKLIAKNQLFPLGKTDSETDFRISESTGADL